MTKDHGDFYIVAGAGIEPASQGYEPCEVPLLYPAILFLAARCQDRYSTRGTETTQVRLRSCAYVGCLVFESKSRGKCKAVKLSSVVRYKPFFSF